MGRKTGKSSSIIIFIGLASTVLFCLNVTAVFGQDRFVAANGSDRGDCTSRDCATVGYAIGQAEAGDAVYIKPGTYNLADEPNRRVNISKALTVTAFDQQDMPVLQGVRSVNVCVHITSDNVTLSYVKVYHGTERTGFSGWASAIRIDGENVTVDHCEARYSYHGIEIRNRRNITISNSKCYENGQYFESAAKGNGHGIVHNTSRGTMATSWDEKIYLLNNDCYNNWGDGFQCGNDHLSNFVEIDGGNYYGNSEDGFDFKTFDNYRVHGVRVYENLADGIKCNNNDGDSQGSIDIYNNQIFRNGYTGILDGDPNDAPRVRIFHNLIYDNAKCIDGTCADYGEGGRYDKWGTWGIWLKVPTTQVYGNVIYNNGATDGNAIHGAINCDGDGVGIIRNNIFFRNGNTGLHNFDTSAAVENHNFIYPNEGLSSLDPSDIVTFSNPGFLAPEQIDFRIGDQSPCRNAGVYDPDFPTDFAGNSIENADSRNDIGAYVYGSPTTGLPFADTPAPPTGLRVN